MKVTYIESAEIKTRVFNVDRPGGFTGMAILSYELTPEEQHDPQVGVFVAEVIVPRLRTPVQDPLLPDLGDDIANGAKRHTPEAHIRDRALAVAGMMCGAPVDFIPSNLIGYVRRFLMVPWSSQWNTMVRDVTAKLEKD